MEKVNVSIEGNKTYEGVLKATNKQITFNLYGDNPLKIKEIDTDVLIPLSDVKPETIKEVI